MGPCGAMQREDRQATGCTAGGQVKTLAGVKRSAKLLSWAWHKGPDAQSHKGSFAPSLQGASLLAWSCCESSAPALLPGPSGEGRLEIGRAEEWETLPFLPQVEGQKN